MNAHEIVQIIYLMLGMVGLVRFAGNYDSAILQESRKHTKRKKKGRNKKVVKPRKVKVAKRNRLAVAPKLSATEQAVYDRYYIGRTFVNYQPFQSMPL